MSTPAPRATEPPYRRVKQHVRAGLLRGDWPPGTPLPSEAELVAQFGVSRMTVNRALRELQADGLIQRVQGVGSFAAPLHKVAATLKLRDVHEEIEARGHRHSVRVVVQRQERAPAEVAAQLGLAAGAAVDHVLLVHHENGTPIQIEDRWVNPAEAPGFGAADFSATTPTQLLFERTQLQAAQYAIEALPAGREEAALLGIEPGAACLVVSRRTESRRGVITIARLTHPGSRYLLQGEFQP